MAAASVTFRLNSGETQSLDPGGTIGRGTDCQLHFEDRRISEVHATVSLRGGQLKLVAGPQHVRVDGQPLDKVVLTEGLCIDLVEGIRLEVVDVQLPAASNAVGSESTIRGTFHPPMKLVLRSETVHIHPRGRDSIVVNGRPAQIVCELFEMGTLVSWEVVAQEIWGSDRERGVLRSSWDRTLRRLRGSLKGAGLREDLVRPDFRGNVELYLLPDDEVVDEL